MAGSDVASGVPFSCPVLHAAELTFFHPITNQPLRFQMPLPKDLRDWLLALPTKKPAPKESDAGYN